MSPTLEREQSVIHTNKLIYTEGQTGGLKCAHAPETVP